jgi:hypothetical protein
MERDYTFVLKPKRKTTFAAGKYDRNTREPSYAMRLSVPEHVRNLVDVKQFLLEMGDGYEWTWEIWNRSDYPVFAIVTRDGELLSYRDVF